MSRLSIEMLTFQITFPRLKSQRNDSWFRLGFRKSQERIVPHSARHNRAVVVNPFPRNRWRNVGGDDVREHAEDSCSWKKMQRGKKKLKNGPVQWESGPTIFVPVECTGEHCTPENPWIFIRTNEWESFLDLAPTFSAIIFRTAKMLRSRLSLSLSILFRTVSRNGTWLETVIHSHRGSFLSRRKSIENGGRKFRANLRSRTLRTLGRSDGFEINESHWNSQELCHYQGSVRDLPGSWVALSTCRGLRGVVFDGENLHHIQPEREESLDSRHYVYRHSDLIANHTCGNYFSFLSLASTN